MTNKRKEELDFTYLCPGVSRGLRHAISLSQNWAMQLAGKIKILVVGSGNGYELVHFLNQGHDATAVDIKVPDVQIVKEHTVKADASKMPFKDKHFDLVFCCEMMEHVPAAQTDAVLKECQRVAQNYYFTIATEDDPPFHEHCTIHSGSWWVNKFESLGFVIEVAQIRPRVILSFGKGLLNVIGYLDGVMLNGRC